MKNFIKLLTHKWFFALASRKVGGISTWDVIVHDLSTFLPSERINRLSRHTAIRLHHNRNAHHIEHWIRTDIATGLVYRASIPEKYLRQVIADWMATTRQATGRWPVRGCWGFLFRRFANLNNMLTYKTLLELRAILAQLEMHPQPCLYNVNGGPFCGHHSRNLTDVCSWSNCPLDSSVMQRSNVSDSGVVSFPIHVSSDTVQLVSDHAIVFLSGDPSNATQERLQSMIDVYSKITPSMAMTDSEYERRRRYTLARLAATALLACEACREDKQNEQNVE